MFSAQDVIEYLEYFGVVYTIVGDREDPFIRTGINGDNGVFEIIIYVDKENSLLIFRICDFVKNMGKLTYGKRLSLLELLNEDNHSKFFGKVYLDENNSLTYDYSMPFDDNEIGGKTFFRTLYACFEYVDDLYPQIMKLLWT